MVKESNDIIIIPEDNPKKNGHKFSVDSDSPDNVISNSNQFVGSCLFYFIIGFFCIIISAGVYVFYKYDKNFRDNSKLTQKMHEDSIRRVERNILSGKMAEEYLKDSVRRAELNEVKVADSLEFVRRLNELSESRRQDSIRVDTFMTHVIMDISKSNIILARYLDGKNFIYYFTDKSSPTYHISCFDGVSKQIYTIINNINGRYNGHFVSPDYCSLIILCMNQSKKLGFAYKIDMAKSNYLEYTPFDDDGNQCYELKCTSDGFYMKFGKVDNNNVKHSYICYYDRYGNYITQN